VKSTGALRSLPALLVGILIGLAIFGGLQYYFKTNPWVSIAIAVFAGFYAWSSPAFDLIKKGYEVRKLQLELPKLHREEQADEREKDYIIQSPTAEQIERYGRSLMQRTLEEKFRTIGEDELRPRRFVVDASEKKFRAHS
jgi:hypothetical protein